MSGKTSSLSIFFYNNVWIDFKLSVYVSKDVIFIMYENRKEPHLSLKNIGDFV